MSGPFIELRQVRKSFRQGENETHVLRGITLSIREGEFIAVMGQSGSGKSTLMNVIGCLDQLSTGEYVLEGKIVPDLSRDDLADLRLHTFGFIFQRYNLVAGLTALENVEIPAVYAGVSPLDRRARAVELLTSLGLGDKLHYMPSELSGGQQQRVSIARALVNGGRIILADEPTGALDSRSGAEVMAILHGLNAKGHTVIMVTHDPGLAEQAGRIIRLKDGEMVKDGLGGSAKPLAVAVLAESPPPERTSLPFRLREALRMGMHSLHVNRFRTLLTMLGIIIGVGSVVTMLAIGNGAKKEVLDRIQAMGTNLLMVRPGAPGVRGTGGAVVTLVPSDAEALARLPGVEAVVPEMIQPVTVRYGNRDFSTSVDATVTVFPSARNWPVSAGAFFGEEAMARYSQVAVLGQTVVENLFPEQRNIVGEHVLIGNIPFLVVGVMAVKGTDSGGNDLDNMVWVPLSTGSARLFGQRFLRTIAVQAASAQAMPTVQESIRRLLLQRHKTEDFQVRSMASLLETASQTQNTLTWLLGAIAAISLFVGGIGVMNIMMVSVTERTREIGIRMAAGGRSGDVLLQFLSEAVIVCLTGGLIGVSIGIGCGLAVSKAMGWLAVFSSGPIILAFSCAFAVGILFGYLPARKAARLDPVVALATE